MRQLDSLNPAAPLTANANSPALDLGAFNEAVIFLKTTAVSGTAPTLDVKVQTSYDGTDWYDEGTSFTQITAVITPAVRKITNFGNYVRLVFTVGGTTPSFTVVSQIVAKANP